MVFPLFSGRFASWIACVRGGTGRNSYQDSFFLRHLFANAESILILYRKYLVVNAGVQYIRHKTCADTLDLVGSCGSFGEDRRSSRLYGNHFHIRILRLQILTGSGDRSAGTYTCYEDIYFSVCIVPDLRTGGCFMCTVGFAGFTNCPGMKLFGISFASSSAFAMAPFIPFAPSVSTSSAP